jgi:hypothetical protein
MFSGLHIAAIIMMVNALIMIKVFKLYDWDIKSWRGLDSGRAVAGYAVFGIFLSLAFLSITLDMMKPAAI